jgi:predicted GNAT family acetyltransferase
MKIFGKKEPASDLVTSGRFELDRDGQVAYLEYTLARNVLALLNTEVPPTLRGLGLSSSLAHGALEWAREHKMKVDVVCPSVAGYIEKHPEYSDLLLR